VRLDDTSRQSELAASNVRPRALVLWFEFRPGSENSIMASRFVTLIAASAAFAFSFGVALAADERPFDAKAFQAAEEAGKPILVEVHATWCPTCKAQKPILSELTAQPKFKDLEVFRVDFDDQKDVVKGFGVQMQSTLITFHGKTETGRSVGDTDRSSIAALLDKAL
jgi:thiol-disulfide isomerase/thioredoxin